MTLGNFYFFMSFFLSLLFILQIIIALLLILVVLMQSSDEDVLSNISSGSNKFGSLSRRTSVDFITKFTIVLGSMLMINSFLLASMSARRYAKEEITIKEYLKENSGSSKKEEDKSDKQQEQTQKQE